MPEFERPYKLIGKNYTTADLHAKVTGQAKYAEDFRAEGMLFCKLLLSPLPHGRVRRIDASRALAMPGVKAMLTADELPAPADNITDNGTVIKANKWTERGLTMEPLYQGEPILAVAAVDELTAADAIEAIRIDFERLPFVIDPLDTLRPRGPNPRTDGNVWVRDEQQLPKVAELKWTDADFREASEGRLPIRTGIRRPDELEGTWQKVREEAAAGHRTFVVVPLIDEADAVDEASASGDGAPAGFWDASAPAAGAACDYSE